MYSDQAQATPLILVVSAPGDPRAARLADDLYAMGLDVKLADTPDVAERFAYDALCIAVLRPSQWNAPAIVATVRAAPPFLLPVFAEQMALPNGPWTAAPIPMQSPRQVAGEVADAIEESLRAQRVSRPRGRGQYDGDDRDAPPRSGGGGYPNDSFSMSASRSYPRGGPGDSLSASMSRPSMRRSAVAVAPRLAPKKSGGAGRVFGSILSVVLIVAVVGGLRLYGTKLINKFLNHATTTQLTTYAAAVPGPTCDKGAAHWAKQDGVNLTCQPDGMVITQSANFDKLQGVGFTPPTQAIGASYHVDVVGTLKNGSDLAYFGLEVHRQIPLGGQVFAIQFNGAWGVERFGTTATDGNHTLAQGFLAQPAKTYTLAVDVQGPVMQYAINGTVVDTITDTTFTSSNEIDLVMNAGVKTGTTSVSFANYTYKGLPAPAITADQAAATATATTKAGQVPYKAAVPGFGCDKGTAQWMPPNVVNEAAGSFTQMQCLSNGLQITQKAQTTTPTHVGEEFFYWQDGNFSANYSVSAQIVLSTTRTCAGIITRGDGLGGGYWFIVCTSGSWGILLAPAGKPTAPLKTGTIAASKTYSIQATSNGTTEQFAINGTQVGSVSDATLTSTNDVDLFVSAPNAGTVGTAVFSTFTFTPLP